MSPSRREFLQTSTMAVAGLSLGRLDPLSPEWAEKSKGLLFDKSDLPRLRRTIKHPRFAPFWKSLSEADLDADSKFLKEELRLNNHVADFLKARVILERTSFVHLLNGDAKQLEVARLAIARILEYKKWDYFLEAEKDTIGLQRAPETTIAMAFALEWLGDAAAEFIQLWGQGLWIPQEALGHEQLSAGHCLV